MFNFKDVNEKLSQDKISKIKDIIGWLLDSYYKATGFKVIFVDKKGKMFLSSTSDGFFCKICKLIQSREEGERKCLETFHSSALKITLIPVAL